MSTKTKQSGFPVILGIIVGIALMFGGMYLSVNEPIAAIADLEHDLELQGILIDIGKTVAVIGVFLILFPVIKSFFVKPLEDAIHERNSELEKTFTEAEQLRADMTQMKSDYERRIGETEANAREQIQAQIKEAQELRKTLNAEAQAQADEYKQRAIAEIEAEKQRALTDLRVNVTNLSLQATERLLGENMDNDKNRRLIDEFLSKVEVKN